jgi:hypothetical protein
MNKERLKFICFLPFHQIIQNNLLRKFKKQQNILYIRVYKQYKLWCILHLKQVLDLCYDTLYIPGLSQ